MPKKTKLHPAVAQLVRGWTSIDALCRRHGWLQHSARSFISVQSRRIGARVERRRRPHGTFYRFRADQRGATAIEYALTAGGIALTIIPVAASMGASLHGVFQLAILALQGAGQ